MARSVAEGAAAERRFAVFLDRDGVINRRPAEGAYVERVADFELLPGVGDALAELSRAGATLLVVTNQRGVARGMVAPEALEEMHRAMAVALADAGAPLAGVYVCPHERDACDCRKPLPGLFLRAQADFPWIDFAASEMVGDSISDARAAHALGIRSWIVGADREDVAREAESDGLYVAGHADSLSELVSSAGFRGAVGLP